MPATETIAPVARTERLDSLDVVRGAAILGILLINMRWFFNPIYLDFLGQTWFDDPLSVGIDRAVHGLARGKFYTIFAMLFGMGLAIQVRRFHERGRPFPGFWARRMLVLLLFGLLHAWLVWYGDILTWYALGGFALVLFRNAKAKTLKIWVVVLLVVPLLVMIGLMLLLQLILLVPQVADEVTASLEEQATVIETAVAEARERYPQAGVAETLGLNGRQWVRMASSFPWVLPSILGMFLIGVLFVRHRLFHDAVAHLPRMRAALVWLVPVALVSNGACVLLHGRFVPLIPNGLSILNTIAQAVGQLSGCLTYVFLLLIAFHSTRMRRFVAPLGAVGRMALTSYLTHSLVFTLLANGYGAGLYGRVSPAAGLLLTSVMFGLQIALSNLWLRHFRFGPFEWLWRSMTYGKLQPFRRGG